ncbi:MAG: hypothetical protein MRY64_14740 [Hyphomonadaceae bacterium]|nr:hypothetical protein [Hyphomonadaceae bacterium]
MILGCKAFAHRGLWSPDGPPENSIAAFRAAAETGCGIELDVQLSSDNVPVVFHDPALDRMTAENGPVWFRTAEELSAIKLAGTDETIPTLTAVLTALPAGMPVLIELKASPGEAADYLRALDMALFGAKADLAVMSFLHPLNLAARQVMSARTRGVLITPPNALSSIDVPEKITASSQGCAPDYYAVWHSEAQSSRAHLGPDTPLAAWTVDSKEALAEASAAGASIIFEHLDPALVLKTVSP